MASIQRAICYVSQEISVPVELKKVGDTDIYEVVNYDEIIDQHRKKSRFFNRTLYPDLINGVFQRAHYRGDTDSAGSRWIQHLLQSPAPHIIQVERNWDNYFKCKYDKYYTVYLEFIN